jgi:hypothetical protein
MELQNARNPSMGSITENSGNTSPNGSVNAYSTLPTASGVFMSTTLKIARGNSRDKNATAPRAYGFLNPYLVGQNDLGVRDRKRAVRVRLIP